MKMLNKTQNIYQNLEKTFEDHFSRKKIETGSKTKIFDNNIENQQQLLSK